MPDAPRPLPKVAFLIAALAILILAAFVTTIVVLLHGSGAADAQAEQLASLYYGTVVDTFNIADLPGPTTAAATTELAAPTTVHLPPWLQPFGFLPLCVIDGSLRLSMPGPTSNGTKLSFAAQAGGVDAGATCALPTPAGQTMLWQVVVNQPDDSDMTTQVFVADVDPATQRLDGHAVRWQAQGQRMWATLPDGRTAPGSEYPWPPAHGQQLVRLYVQGDAIAINFTGGGRVYGGPSGLAHGEARYFGVRFVSRSGRVGGGLSIASMRLLKP